jgi:hypothetical protein
VPGHVLDIIKMESEVKGINSNVSLFVADDVGFLDCNAVWTWRNILPPYSGLSLIFVVGILKFIINAFSLLLSEICQKNGEQNM